MSHNLACTISESFLEISGGAQGQATISSQRYYLPQRPLKKAIEDFLNESGIEDIKSCGVSLKTPRTILKKRLGSSPAFLVTQGFENWVDMNLPIDSTSFTLAPKRKKSPLNQNLIFGINERTLASGENEKPIDTEELEFLASKLSMDKVSTIAIGFLHSHKNDSNLNAARTFFEDKGYKVFPLQTHSSETQERSRWLRPILDAYVSSTIEEHLESLLEVDSLNQSKSSIFLSTGTGLLPEPKNCGIDSCFGELSHLSHAYNKKGNSYYYFGFDESYLFDGQPQMLNRTPFELGPVEVSCPEHFDLSLSPGHRISSNFWGTLSLEKDVLGYEPGPMSFGRGVKPTLFDLLFLKGYLESIEPIDKLIKINSKKRIEDSLATLTRGTSREMMTSDLLIASLKQILLPLASQLTSKPGLLTGPFAPCFANALTDLFKLDCFEVDPQSEFSSTQSLLKNMEALS